MKKNLFLLLVLILALSGCNKKTTSPQNNKPVIESLTASSDTLKVSETIFLYCIASDEDNDNLNIMWNAKFGNFIESSTGDSTKWQAPEESGTYFIKVTVCDEDFTVIDSIAVMVLEKNKPIINSITASTDIVLTNETVLLECIATDEDSDELTYSWSSQNGSFPDGNSGSSLNWQSPGESGNYFVIATVSDGDFNVKDSIEIIVNEPVFSFTPFPANETEGLARDTILSWNFSVSNGNSILYDVYFGISDNPDLVSSDQSETSCNPGSLLPRQTYYWKVVAKDDQDNEYSSPVWSFTTTHEQTFELGNTGVHIEMVWITPGSYMMGRPYTQGYGDDEIPSHLVTFTYGYWIGKYEITQEQWEAIKGNWNFTFDGYPNRPAENISFNDITNFLTQLNNQEDAECWRLPSESEWEYCARAEHYNTRFWWGDDPSYQELSNHAWSNQNSNNRTHDVGTTAGNESNPFGIWDMTGNVWEFCQDYYHTDYNGAPDDGSAWMSPVSNSRALRGGSFNNLHSERQCLPNLRSWYFENQRVPTMGFRIVRNSE